MEGFYMDFTTIIHEHQKTVDYLLKNCLDDIKAAADACRTAVRAGHTVFFCGNGGSAADCQHIAAEFVGRFVKERRGLPAVALTTDTSILTAVGNDYGFKQIFARQVEALARKGDVMISISTSGNSENLLVAMEKAKELGVLTIALTGEKVSKCGAAADVSVRVPSFVTARIQECHIMIGHMICQYVDEDF